MSSGTNVLRNQCPREPMSQGTNVLGIRELMSQGNDVLGNQCPRTTMLLTIVQLQGALYQQLYSTKTTATYNFTIVASQSMLLLQHTLAFQAEGQFCDNVLCVYNIHYTTYFTLIRTFHSSIWPHCCSFPIVHSGLKCVQSVQSGGPSLHYGKYLNLLCAASS